MITKEKIFKSIRDAHYGTCGHVNDYTKKILKEKYGIVDAYSFNSNVNDNMSNNINRR